MQRAPWKTFLESLAARLYQICAGRVRRATLGHQRRVGFTGVARGTFPVRGLPHASTRVQVPELIGQVVPQILLCG